MGTPTDILEGARDRTADPAPRADEQEAGEASGAANTAADRVEQALGVLDTLTQTLSDVDRLKELVAELVVENRRLKGDNVRLARALVSGGQGAEAVATLKAAQEKVRIRQQQVEDLLEENTELQSRVLELEELNGSMMSMYVSSYQLHATLDVHEVVRVIEEIIVNFIGASAYAVILLDEDSTFRVVGERSLDGRLAMRGIQPKGVLAEVLGSRTAYVHTSNRAAREGILAAVPLVMGANLVGAVLIFELLSQKERLLKNDVELLSLLGGHAASAVVSAQLYAKADRKLKTLEGMLELLGDTGS